MKCALKVELMGLLKDRYLTGQDGQRETEREKQRKSERKID